MGTGKHNLSGEYIQIPWYDDIILMKPPLKISRSTTACPWSVHDEATIN